MKVLAFILAFFAALGPALGIDGSVHGQTTPPIADTTQQDIDEFKRKNAEEAKKTEDFINQTQSKIDLMEAETEARTKELEALANRVGDIISTISSKDEDNSNLRSELSVSTELLSIERSTTGGLRQEAALLEDQIEVEKKAREKAEAKLKSNIATMNTELIEKEKKLITALQTVAALTKTKTNLEFDILALKIRLDQLEKDVALTKRRRNRTPRRARLPRRLNP